MASVRKDLTIDFEAAADEGLDAARPASGPQHDRLAAVAGSLA